jgi:hypothetical protein
MALAPRQAWFPGRVTHFQSGIYAIAYDDGDHEDSVRPAFVRAASAVVPTPPTAPPAPSPAPALDVGFVGGVSRQAPAHAGASHGQSLAHAVAARAAAIAKASNPSLALPFGTWILASLVLCCRLFYPLSSLLPPLLLSLLFVAASFRWTQLQPPPRHFHLQCPEFKHL